MNRIIFQIDKASFHVGHKILDFYKTNQLKVIVNPHLCPEFCPVERLFNHWKKLVKT